MENNTIFVALKYVVGRLKTMTPSLPVYTGVAPETATYPLLLVQPYGETTEPLTAYHYGPVLGTVEVSVRVVGIGSLEDLEPYVNKLDGLLRKETPEAQLAGVIAHCERTRDQLMTYTQSGRTTHLAGAIYEVVVT